jgi:hypothetical protein
LKNTKGADFFKKNIETLSVFSNSINKPTIFISKEPAVDEQFVFGMVDGKKLFLMNPLGIKKQAAYYQIFSELKQTGILSEIFFSSNQFQKENELEKPVSSGPIVLEFAMHILENFTPEELLHFWDQAKTSEFFLHESSQLHYQSVSLEQKLLPLKLKALQRYGGSDNEETEEREAYQALVCLSVREMHFFQLQRLIVGRVKTADLSTHAFLEKCEAESAHQFAFNQLRNADDSPEADSASAAATSLVADNPFSFREINPIPMDADNAYEEDDNDHNIFLSHSLGNIYASSLMTPAAQLPKDLPISAPIIQDPPYPNQHPNQQDMAATATQRELLKGLVVNSGGEIEIDESVLKTLESKEFSLLIDFILYCPTRNMTMGKRIKMSNQLITGEGENCSESARRRVRNMRGNYFKKYAQDVQADHERSFLFPIAECNSGVVNLNCTKPFVSSNRTQIHHYSKEQSMIYLRGILDGFARMMPKSWKVYDVFAKREIATGLQLMATTKQFSAAASLNSDTRMQQMATEADRSISIPLSPDQQDSMSISAHSPDNSAIPYTHESFSVSNRVTDFHDEEVPMVSSVSTTTTSTHSISYDVAFQTVGFLRPDNRNADDGSVGIETQNEAPVTETDFLDDMFSI